MIAQHVPIDLNAELAESRAKEEQLRDMLSYQQGYSAAFTSLIQRMQAHQGDAPDALPPAPDHEPEHKHECS